MQSTVILTSQKDIKQQSPCGWQRS